MKTVTVQEIKSRGSKAISDTEASFLIVNSKVKSVILPEKQYNMLVSSVHELEEIKDILVRRREKDLTFDEVKTKLARKHYGI